jgi:hypothetical protein
LRPQRVAGADGWTSHPRRLAPFHYRTVTVKSDHVRGKDGGRTLKASNRYLVDIWPKN